MVAWFSRPCRYLPGIDGDEDSSLITNAWHWLLSVWKAIVYTRTLIPTILSWDPRSLPSRGPIPINSTRCQTQVKEASPTQNCDTVSKDLIEISWFTTKTAALCVQQVENRKTGGFLTLHLTNRICQPSLLHSFPSSNILLKFRNLEIHHLLYKVPCSTTC